jgi:hypothetical protein
MCGKLFETRTVIKVFSSLVPLAVNRIVIPIHLAQTQAKTSFCGSGDIPEWSICVFAASNLPIKSLSSLSNLFYVVITHPAT